ncbi:MAG: hypothetical protein CBC48_01970 [bacterium TMED88]|nr:hypothetical protein [Deltaproteobacteria bacterium]OUV36668.1 MAG: hypothetical protein CBC48_01970 [bacterium TMED88]
MNRPAMSLRRWFCPGQRLGILVWSVVWALAELSCSPAEQGPNRSMGPESVASHASIESAAAEPAPDFELAPLGGGERVQLEALRGQTVVLDFWATWCAPCVRQVPPLNAVFDLYRQRGDVQVFGISVDLDGLEVVQEWAAEQGVRYPILMGGEDVAHRYGALGFPATFVVDPEGRIRQRHVGVVTAEDLDRTIGQIRREARPDPDEPRG